MSIAARCGDCQKLYKVDDKLAGKRVRCKDCGGVVEVPAQAESRAAAAPARAPAVGRAPAAPAPARSPGAARAPAAAPSRKPAARPAPPPAQDDDPFSNLDALMSLEGSGTVTDEPPPIRAPKPSRTTASSSGDGILAPAAYSPSLNVRAPGESPARFRAGPTLRANAYISLAGEDTIDGLVPMASIGILIIFLVITFIRTMSAASHAPEEVQAQVSGIAFGILLGIYAIILLVIFGIFSPLCMLGVFIASKIMNFERPGSFYLRCAAVICAPISLGIVVNGFGFGAPTALGWVVTLPVMLGVLWLMFRLKPIPYLVSAAFSLICAVGIPVMLIVVLVLAMGGSLRTFAALGNARATANQVKSGSQLRQIGMAMALFANEHKGQYPRSLEDLTSVENFNRALINSPAGPKPYVYNYFPNLTTANAGAYLVAYDPNPSPYGGVECLFGDGHVDQLNPSDLEKAQQLNEQIRRGGARGGGTITSPGSTQVPAQPRVNRPVDFAAHHARVEASFRNIAGAIKSYAASHRGYYPASFLELRNPGLANSDFYSPFGLPFVYVSPRGAKPPLPGKMVLVFEDGVRDNRRTVLWGDLRVETIAIENWDQILSESVRLRSQLPH